MSHSFFYQILLWYFVSNNLIAATTANNETCNSHSQIYIQENQSCYLKSGAPCRDFTNQVLECVPKAICDIFSGKCNCTSSHYPTDKGNCAPKHLFTESCSVSKQCIGNLECIKGKCLCDPRKKLGYHHGLQRCSTLAGFVPKDYSCVQNAYYNSFQCHCDSTSFTSPKGYCHRTYGYGCNTKTAPCASEIGLMCKNEVCKCMFSNQTWRWFNQGHQECRSTPGQPCSAEVTSLVDGTSKRKLFNCTDNYACLPRKDNDQVYECQCSRPGYEQVGDECLKGFGSHCDSSSECDTKKNLQCIKNQCNCAVDELEYFDEKEKVCRGLEGAVCTLKENPEFCTPGAGCTIKDASTYQICLCEPGYRITQDRKCERSNMKIEMSTTEKLAPNSSEELT